MQQNKRRQKYVSTTNYCIYALLICALIAAGCAKRISAQPDVKMYQGALEVGQSRDLRKAEMMEIAEDVLAGMHFTIEKADVQSGFIRTRPLPGAQFFEFWRSDNVGADNALAANLHTIRRTVTIDISQQDKLQHIGCEVQVQRLSLPEPQAGSSARVYEIFSRSSPSLQRLSLNPEQKKDMVWIDLDRDSRLEQEILKRIVEQIIQRAGHKLQMTEN